jgi:tripartite-type tricarboxylate transporter receptor subunit TctC
MNVSLAQRAVAGGMLAAMLAAVMTAPPASAQSVEEFYKGKTLQINVGFGVGASYDTYARVLAEHIVRHIPGNPRAVVVNMEGAGSLRLANWLYNAAPKDGTVFGTTSRAAPFASLIGTQGGTSFDPTQFSWIGSANNEVSTCVSWHTAAVKTFDQLRETDLIIGGDGPSADGEQFARIMNALFDTRIRIVSGYPGGNAINLAVERGEVHGRCGWSWSGVVAERRQWIDERKINVLVQFGLNRHPDLPDVPMILDYAKTEEQKQILQLVLARQPLGRPFLAPPGIPADRADALRRAFMATMADPQFIAAAQKSKLEINPLSGAEVAALVNGVFATVSPAAVSRTKEILSRN